MKFKGQIELDIDIKDMSGDFMNAHELEYDNNRLYKLGQETHKRRSNPNKAARNCPTLP